MVVVQLWFPINKYRISDFKTIVNPIFEIRNQNSETRNQNSQVRNQKSLIINQKPEVEISENAKFKIEKSEI